MGVASLFKLHAAIWLPALACAVVAAPRGFEPALLTRRLTALAAGVALAPGLAWAYFAMRGGQHALVYWNVGNNLSYIDNDPLATEWIGRAAATLLPFVVVTAPLWWLSYWRRRVAGPGDVYRDALVTALLVLVAGRRHPGAALLTPTTSSRPTGRWRWRRRPRPRRCCFR